MPTSSEGVSFEIRGTTELDIKCASGLNFLKKLSWGLQNPLLPLVSQCPYLWKDAEDASNFKNRNGMNTIGHQIKQISDANSNKKLGKNEEF